MTGFCNLKNFYLTKPTPWSLGITFFFAEKAPHSLIVPMRDVPDFPSYCQHLCQHCIRPCHGPCLNVINSWLLETPMDLQSRYVKFFFDPNKPFKLGRVLASSGFFDTLCDATSAEVSTLSKNGARLAHMEALDKTGQADLIQNERKNVSLFLCPPAVTGVINIHHPEITHSLAACSPSAIY